MSQEATSETTQADPEQTPEAPQEFPTLTLRKDQLYQELMRLDSDPEIRQVLRSWAGNTAKRQYLPELQARDNQIAQLRAEKFQVQLSTMTESEIQSKLVSDSNFRTELNDYLSRQQPGQAPRRPAEDPAEVEAAVNDLAWWAHNNGLSEAAWKQLADKAARGEYRQGANEHWSLGLSRWQQDIASELLKAKAPDEAPKGNPALAKPGPDVSRGTAGASSGAFPRTAEEFNKLPSAEQRRWLASDYDRVVALSKK